MKRVIFFVILLITAALKAPFFRTGMEARFSEHPIQAPSFRAGSLTSSISYSDEWNKLSKESQERLLKGEIILKIDYIKETSDAVVNGAVLIEAPIEIVWEVVNDYENFEEILPNTLDSRIIDLGLVEELEKMDKKNLEDIKRRVGRYSRDLNVDISKEEDNRIFYNYELLDSPWPMSDRWTILKWVQKENDSNHKKTVWNSVGGNVEKVSGYWILESIDKTKTLAIYKNNLRFDLPIPGVVIKFVMSFTGPDVFKAVRKRSVDILKSALNNR